MCHDSDTSLLQFRQTDKSTVIAVGEFPHQRGEPVDPAQVYFRCSPSFETTSKALAWIHERIFVGTGARHPDQVVLRYFTLT